MNKLLSKQCCLLAALSLCLFTLPKTIAAEVITEATKEQSGLLKVNAHVNFLDDFVDKGSRLNQMLAQKRAPQLVESPMVEQALKQAVDAQWVLFARLTLERQKLVNRLRVLQRDNLRRVLP
jgi:hypothetical protein